MASVPSARQVKTPAPEARRPSGGSAPQQAKTTPEKAGAAERGPARAAVRRVLVMSHSHPALTQGGAEISAHALFRGLKSREGITSWFLGCSTRAHTDRFGPKITQPFGSDDFVYQVTNFDVFKFANHDPYFTNDFEDLIAELKPDVVHSHHFLSFGIESFAAVKRAWPSAKIVLSLHEYLAICHNNGQMIKTKASRLCYRESPQDCSACFPEIPAREFFLRKRYVQAFFQDVDLFVSPSQFLAEPLHRLGPAAGEGDGASQRASGARRPGGFRLSPGSGGRLGG